jgi:cyclophilin family peptidyl-prolyl cis-trans isomerase
MIRLVYNILVFSFLCTSFFQVSAQKIKKSKKDQLITISTAEGDINLILFDQTPLHKANFLKLIDQKFYDELLFHRVIENFMIQGGDPESKSAEKGAPLGSGDVGYKIPAEFVPELFHEKGALAAARDNNPAKESSGCQFYIVHGKVWKEAELKAQAQRAARKPTDEQTKVYTTIGGTPHLDGAYTVFGKVIKGIDVVGKIAKVEKDMRDRPLEDIRMKVSAKKMSKKKITRKYGYKFS